MRKLFIATLVTAFMLLSRDPAEAVPSVADAAAGTRAIAQLFPGKATVSAAKYEVTSSAGTQKYKAKDAKALSESMFESAGWFFDNTGRCLWVPDQTKFVTFAGTYNVNTKGVIVANLNINTSTPSFAARGQMSATISPKKNNYIAKIVYAIAVSSASGNVVHETKATQILQLP